MIVRGNCVMLKSIYNFDTLNGCRFICRHWRRGLTESVSVVVVTPAEIERIKEEARRDYERQAGGRPQ